MPFKANQDRRHHIPKQRHRVTNWAAYDIALRQRGSLTVWFTEAAIAAWKAEPRATRGGQPRYSALAITTALTLRAVFRLALRQTEGLIASLLRLILSFGWTPRAVPITSRRVHHMVGQVQAATPAAARRKAPVCARWRTDHGRADRRLSGVRRVGATA